MLASGDAARRLALRLLALPTDRLARLQGVAGSDLVALVGDEADLPWVDGARYLGRDPSAPALLLPTALAVGAHPALLERAVLAAAPGASPPLAVLPDPLRVVPLGDARPIDPARLRDWLESHR
jgi:hypothetical protein